MPYRQRMICATFSTSIATAYGPLHHLRLSPKQMTHRTTKETLTSPPFMQHGVSSLGPVWRWSSYRDPSLQAPDPCPAAPPFAPQLPPPRRAQARLAQCGRLLDRCNAPVQRFAPAGGVMGLSMNIWGPHSRALWMPFRHYLSTPVHTILFTQSRNVHSIQCCGHSWFG